VSARGVLDGEAEALAGLCDRRGPSVVGYCATICGPERAIEAAIAAFTAFRAGAIRAVDPLSIDPDALLLGRTRAAAAQRAPKPAGGLVFADVPCSQIPALLAENATGSLVPADRERLGRHLARCIACRTTQGLQEQAERVYFHPMTDALDPISRRQIIDALVGSVPAASANGHRPDPPPDPAPVPAPAPVVVQASVARPKTPPALPRSVALAGSASTSTPVGGSPPPSPKPAPSAPPADPSPDGRGTVTPSRAGAVPGQPASGVVRPTPFEEQDTPPSGMPAAAWDSPTGVMSRIELDAALASDGFPTADPGGHRGWPGQPGASPDVGGAGADGPGGAAAADGGGRRRLLGTAIVGRDSSRRPRARVLGPAAVLVVGLLIALFVAGVFNGSGHHASTNPLAGAQTSPSAALPSTGPGATNAGASAASSTRRSTSAATAAAAAARRRAARRRAEELARQLKAGTGAGSTAAKTTTPGAAGSATANPVTQSTPPATAPAHPKTTKPATGAATVHELGTAAGAPPATGIPATGATGYQPG
jgi:hypothetical protein